MAARMVEGTPLPGLMADYEKWAVRAEAGKGDPGVTILAEQQLAIRRDFSPTAWFSPTTWYRAVADVLKLAGNVALLVDWKTGKITEDPIQLALAAACVFSHYPEVQKIRTEFIWLQFDANTTMNVSRDQMPDLWNKLLPELDDLEFETNQHIGVPRRSGLCRSYCSVKSCEFNGKRPNE